MQQCKPSYSSMKSIKRHNRKYLSALSLHLVNKFYASPVKLVVVLRSVNRGSSERDRGHDCEVGDVN